MLHGCGIIYVVSVQNNVEFLAKTRFQHPHTLEEQFFNGMRTCWLSCKRDGSAVIDIEAVGSMAI
jgi:hypothetical protein